MPKLHLVKSMFTDSTHSSDIVAMRKTRLDNGATHVASSTKDLGNLVSKLLRSARSARIKRTIHVFCEGGLSSPGGSHVEGKVKFEVKREGEG